MSTTRRSDANIQAMYQVAWTSPELLREQVGKLSEREKIQTSGAVLRGIFDTDPAAAEAYFLALPESQRNTGTVSEMMRSYSDRDPKKAFDFAISLENPQEQASAISGVFGNWSRCDPEAAADGWKQLPAGESRLSALGQIAGSWATANPIAAKEWANSLSGDQRVRALAAVLPSLADDNPNAAGSQLAALIASPPDGMAKNLVGSAGSFARRWAGDDPVTAADWAAGVPEGQSRDAGLKAVAQSWSSYDAIATAEWLGTLDAGSSRDAAIEPLVRQVRQTDPVTAFYWAASISDEHDRLNQLRQTLQSWRGSDLDGARDALESAELSDKNRRDLAKEFD